MIDENRRFPVNLGGTRAAFSVKLRDSIAFYLCSSFYYDSQAYKKSKKNPHLDFDSRR